MQVSEAPFRHVDFPPVDFDIDRRAEGTLVLTPKEQLNIGVPNVPAGYVMLVDALEQDRDLAKRFSENYGWSSMAERGWPSPSTTGSSSSPSIRSATRSC